VFGQRRITQPSRFLEEIPAGALEKTGGLSGLRSGSPHVARPTSHGHLPPWAAAAAGPGVAPQPPGLGQLRPGTRVRHPLFGVGTVLRLEGEGEALKLTVSFPGVGAKKLVARFAGLELV
jgi:DNA helicase-2/ATP-dependent DNA helicase PcrA